jgi:hypothetical protein
MPLPPPEPDSLFDNLWQDLPPETTAMARALTAFGPAKTVTTPQPRWRLVFVSCGLAKALRDIAADFTLLDETMTDSSMAERFAAWRPWVPAVLATMLPTNAVATLPALWRWLVIDGRHVHGPGAQGTQYRLHLWMDVVP